MDCDAVVIGAGAAGLAAARSLAERSLRVLLLESRDRIGGRVWSKAIAETKMRAELGAEFIHGRATETMRFLREAGLGTLPTDGESWELAENGELERNERDFVSGAGALLEKAYSLAQDESVERFLRRYAGDASMREPVDTARAFVEGFEAADPATASVRAIADELRSGADSTSARPAESYAPMFEFLHDTCVAAGVDVRLDTTVRRISWRRGAVAVDAAPTGATLSTFRARCAIVTLPVGVLRQGRAENGVQFEPSLPQAKRGALANIEMGHVVKVILWFKTPFWERVRDGRYRNGAFFRALRQSFAAYWTLWPQRTNVVVAWAGGPKATALAGVPQPELVERACDGFGALFGAAELARNEFEGGVMHDWRSDPFAHGAYSYVTVGGGDARAALAAPVGETLFFAGEATSIDGQGGTVNGALETGERAAREFARG